MARLFDFLKTEMPGMLDRRDEISRDGAGI
jgi:hypothetical protein